MGEVDFALQHLHQKMVAITGTNGKTTVALLVEHVLNSAKIKAKALGNVGVSVAEYCLAPDPEEILVFELSSYQLETLDRPVFDAGVILNITPDHLDRYENLESYARAKAKLQHCLVPNGVLYLHEQVVQNFASIFSDEYVLLGKENSLGLSPFPKVNFFQGEHDYSNAIAAWALCRKMGVAKEEFIDALQSFKKPSHRIEFVKTIKGVSYYDDSKGTNIDAVIQAVLSMKGPVILIAGGVCKGSSYLPWKEVFQNRVKQLFVLGQAAHKIWQELSLFFNVEIVDSMEEAVIKAAACAKQADVVLLSPGCSSFDMFCDYAHRGKEFQRCVQLLEGEKNDS
jgi:UDP-N-acetylmuramoylalanine--D-glutamate ligase